MHKIIVIKFFCLVSGLVNAENTIQQEQGLGNDQNIFAVNQVLQSFSNETQLLEYIKSNKPSTFRYFDRLDYQAKKQVFKKHQENQEQDITEIVLHVYRMQAKN